MIVPLIHKKTGFPKESRFFYATFTLINTMARYLRLSIRRLWIGHYQTAWTWLHKFKRLMILSGKPNDKGLLKLMKY